MDMACPVCMTGTSEFHARIDGYDYFRCAVCGSLHIHPDVLARIDAGESTRVYDASYWDDELKAARERANGPSLTRVGEAILYARRPVRRFLDIGTGPGYLLDELGTQFPDREKVFFGVELFPPNQHSGHPNYLVGDVNDLQGTFDAGVCIEVIEHLTPRMLDHLVEGLARISTHDSLWLFNTSLAERTLNEDPDYLDPLRRGHIISYSLDGLRKIYEKHGFVLNSVPGKNYAFIVEFDPNNGTDEFEDRINQPLPENAAFLQESGLMFQAAFESARSSFFHAQSMERTRWALAINEELDVARRLYGDLKQEQQRIVERARSSGNESDAAHPPDVVLQERLAAVQQAYEMVLNSTSWRMTRPFRAASCWLQSGRLGSGHGMPQTASKGASQRSLETVDVHEAIILAGGLGTRLRRVIGELPKPLAPVADRPFLAWLLDALARQGLQRVILATGYGADQVEAQLGTRWQGMELLYSREPEPRGTGGATALAAQLLSGDACFVLNGDTSVQLDYTRFANSAVAAGARFGVALSQVEDVSRYGSVCMEQGCITGFVEKGNTGPGYINAGVYWMRRSLLSTFPQAASFSLETDVLVPSVQREPVAAFTETSNFLDIGVPEDYRRAQQLLRVEAARP